MSESRSGGLRSESAEGQPGGVRSGRNHSLDRQRSRQITGKRNPGMDDEIGVIEQRHGNAKGKFGPPGGDEDQCRRCAVRN